MRAVIQRVKNSSVAVAGHIVSEISGGLLVFLGIGPGDDEAKARLLARKIAMVGCAFGFAVGTNRHCQNAGFVFLAAANRLFYHDQEMAAFAFGYFGCGPDFFPLDYQELSCL